MANDTRPRAVLVVVALLVVTMVLATAGCTSTTDESGAQVDEEATAEPYPEAMAEICRNTTRRLDDLPAPPDEISRTDWAREVSKALRDEAEAFGRVEVGDRSGPDHRSLIATTERQAGQWESLGQALADPAASDVGLDSPSDAIGDLTAEIGALTLGRDDLVAEMGLGDCATPGVGG